MSRLKMFRYASVHAQSFAVSSKKHLPLALALLALLSLLLLTGCVQPQPTASLALPDVLLQCDPAPEPPVNPDDHDLANWIVDLSVAGQSCRDNLSAVRKIVEGPKKVSTGDVRLK